MVDGGVLPMQSDPYNNRKIKSSPYGSLLRVRRTGQKEKIK